MLNRFSGPETMEDLMARTYLPGVTDKIAPRNVWGDKLFLVKIQVQPTSQLTNMMLYDRKHSFQVFLVPEDDNDHFTTFLRELWSPRAEITGLKMYRWARRTGDWEFAVCLDRKPSVGPSW